MSPFPIWELSMDGSAFAMDLSMIKYKIFYISSEESDKDLLWKISLISITVFMMEYFASKK